jgi:hypothetical protein
VPFAFNLATVLAVALAGSPNLDDLCSVCGAEDEEPCTIECRTAGALECIEYYATEYLKYRHLATAGTSGYDLGFAYDAYGRDLAVMLGAPDLHGQELQAAAEATLNALDVPVARLQAVATTIGDPVLAAIAHCAYGPGIFAEAA